MWIVWVQQDILLSEQPWTIVIFFLITKITWFFFFFSVEKSVIQISRRKKPAMFLPPADKDCYHFAGCCFSTLSRCKWAFFETHQLWQGVLKVPGGSPEFSGFKNGVDLCRCHLGARQLPLEPGQFFLSSETFCPCSYSRNLNNIG